MKRVAAIVLFLIGLGILLSLGTWQYQRLQWKNAIIATLEHQYESLPTKSSTLTLSRIDHALSEQDNAFLVDRIAGPVQRNNIIFVGPKPFNNKIGYDVVAPVNAGDGIILIDFGWVEETARETIKLPKFAVVGGVARKPDYSSFASQNSPVNNLWFRIDPAQIAEAKNLKNVAPLVFYAQDQVSPAITPHEAHWLPRNKHRQYMVFWFGMAAAWVGVFALAWHRQRQG